MCTTWSLGEHPRQISKKSDQWSQRCYNAILVKVKSRLLRWPSGSLNSWQTRIIYLDTSRGWEESIHSFIKFLHWLQWRCDNGKHSKWLTDVMTYGHIDTGQSPSGISSSSSRAYNICEMMHCTIIRILAGFKSITTIRNNNKDKIFLGPWKNEKKHDLFNPCHAEYIKMPHPLLFVSQSDYLIHVFIQIHILNYKQCRSRSVGFFRSQLIWIYTVWKDKAYLGSAGQA